MSVDRSPELKLAAAFSAGIARFLRGELGEPDNPSPSKGHSIANRASRTVTLALALATLLAVSPGAMAAEGVPHFDVRRTCAADQTARNGIPDPACLQQENQARQQLQAIWGQTKPQARSTCLGSDADSPLKSYVDVLTCVQMFKDAQ
jgi:hypothetical protein